MILVAVNRMKSSYDLTPTQSQIHATDDAITYNAIDAKGLRTYCGKTFYDAVEAKPQEYDGTYCMKCKQSARRRGHAMPITGKPLPTATSLMPHQMIIKLTPEAPEKPVEATPPEVVDVMQEEAKQLIIGALAEGEDTFSSEDFAELEKDLGPPKTTKISELEATVREAIGDEATDLILEGLRQDVNINIKKHYPSQQKPGNTRDRDGRDIYCHFCGSFVQPPLDEHFLNCEALADLYEMAATIKKRMKDVRKSLRKAKK